MKPKFKEVYFNIAKEISSLSYAKRLKVGAIIIKESRIISIGYNGSPSGWPNICEELIKEGHREFLITTPETIHAEMNCLHKLAKSHESGDGAAMFCTHSPCLECAKGIFMSGIKEFYYENEYRANDGLIFLEKSGVFVEKRS